MKQLDPKAVWLFFLNFISSSFFAVIIIAFIAFYIGLADVKGRISLYKLWASVQISLTWALVFFLIFVVISYI